MYPHGEYMVINISCPNVEGGNRISGDEVAAVLNGVFRHRRQRGMAANKPGV